MRSACDCVCLECVCVGRSPLKDRLQAESIIYNENDVLTMTQRRLSVGGLQTGARHPSFFFLEGNKEALGILAAAWLRHACLPLSCR
jgi:hypothetical protein